MFLSALQDVMAVVREAAQPSLLTAAAIRVLRDLAQKQASAKDGNTPPTQKASPSSSSPLPSGRQLRHVGVLQASCSALTAAQSLLLCCLGENVCSRKPPKPLSTAGYSWIQSSEMVVISRILCLAVGARSNIESGLPERLKSEMRL